MPIRKTEFKKGKIYHVYSFGLNGKSIFANENDKERFLQSIYLSNNSNSFRGVPELGKNRENIPIDGVKNILKSRKIKVSPLVSILSLCIMPNHLHLILKEDKKNGISGFMQKIGNSYGKYYSKKYGLKGSVFSGRFKAVQIEKNEQLNYLFAYINAVNPAQLVEPYLKIKGVENFSLVWNSVENYKWSSHLDLMGIRSSLIIDKSLFLKTFGNPKNYNDFAKEVLLGKRNGIWGIIKNISVD
ncbi:MAG: transposase [Candidatus Nealsonbacteria bacterium]|nr:transposase [Candidatus Nealsonbacteria bacterium]